MKLRLGSDRGQVIVMVTLSLLAMGGMLGLVVDLGWAYFSEKAAQTAADTAAYAAVQAAYDSAGPSAPYVCGVGVECSPIPTPCPSNVAKPPANNLQNGCLYAKRNGFFHGGDGGRQFVTMAAGAEFPAAPPPTVPGVPVWYWVTARVGHQVPQLFSAILGNPVGLVSARATAAIASVTVPGVLYGTNIETDPGPWGTGVDLLLSGGQGQNWINALGQIFMASQAHGPGTYAGESNGTGTVTASRINIYGEGWVKEPGTYTPTPVQLEDFSLFSDPIEKITRLVGQPTAPSAAEAPPIPVIGGTISGDCANPQNVPTLVSGTYYAIDGNTGAATGNPIQVSGCVNFGSQGLFNNFVFVGGMHLTSTQTVMKVGPGRYFFAGAKPNNHVFLMRNATAIVDYTPLVGGNAQPTTDLGEIFVFTDQNYPGLPIPSDLKVQLDTLGLGYGRVETLMGTNSDSQLSLHGLNANMKAELAQFGNLQHFTPVVFYVDQGNSRIDYDDGVLQYPGDPGCGNPIADTRTCLSDTSPVADPMMKLQASPNMDMFGTVYLPRGASLWLQGGGNYDAPVQFIAGTYQLRGGTQLNLQPLGPGFSIAMPVLVE